MQTGLGINVQHFANLGTTRLDIIIAMRQLVRKFVIHSGLGMTVEYTVKSKMILQDIIHAKR